MSEADESYDGAMKRALRAESKVRELEARLEIAQAQVYRWSAGQRDTEQRLAESEDRLEEHHHVARYCSECNRSVCRDCESHPDHAREREKETARGARESS